MTTQRSKSRLVVWSDLGYVLAGIIGGLLVLAMPSTTLRVEFCPNPLHGSTAELLSVLVGLVAAVASIAIAMIAHRLNRTLRDADDRRALTSARAFARIALVEVRHQQAVSSTLRDSIQRFMSGEANLGELQGVAHPALRSPGAFLYQNAAIGDLPEQTAQAISEAFAQNSLTEAMYVAIKETPMNPELQFSSFGAEDQAVFRAVHRNLDVLEQHARTAIQEIVAYLQR